MMEYYKVKDHCHFIRKYRGAPCNICNIRYKIPKEILIVFHNGLKHDYHFIILLSFYHLKLQPTNLMEIRNAYQKIQRSI